MVHGEVSFVVSCSATAAPLTITAARMHIDRKKVGPSWAKGFGDYSSGGAVWEFGLHWPKKKKGFEGRPLKSVNFQIDCGHELLSWWWIVLKLSN